MEILRFTAHYKGIIGCPVGVLSGFRLQREAAQRGPRELTRPPEADEKEFRMVARGALWGIAN